MVIPGSELEEKKQVLSAKIHPFIKKTKCNIRKA